MIDQWIYDPIHDSLQTWITSDFGELVNGWINTSAGQFLIGNGLDGTADDPDGGNGGLWFGDGGDGWNSTTAGVAGGNGGNAAGWIGDGGIGGDGGAIGFEAHALSTLSASAPPIDMSDLPFIGSE
jgi:hypothetical protein